MNDRPTDDLRVVRSAVGQIERCEIGSRWMQPVMAVVKVQRRWEVKNPAAKVAVCTVSGFQGLDANDKPVPAFLSEWRDLPEVEG